MTSWLRRDPSMPQSTDAKLSFSLDRLRNLFRKRKKPEPNPEPYHHVPIHAASSHLATTCPMTLRQRMAVAPERLPLAIGAQQQPTKTLAEQAEEMRARGRERAQICIGDCAEKSESEVDYRSLCLLPNCILTSTTVQVDEKRPR
ncbi:hypothetical protein MMC16_001597 [Acarospora aff. strigata]|nr:hypothetical protein [Acarospora aff. strigata]